MYDIYCWPNLFRHITNYLVSKYGNQYNDTELRKWKKYRYDISTVNVIFLNLPNEDREYYKLLQNIHNITNKRKRNMFIAKASPEKMEELYQQGRVLKSASHKLTTPFNGLITYLLLLSRKNVI